MENNTRLPMPMKNKIGFGMGGMTGAIIGDFFYVYFLVFLTSAVGLSGKMAGLIGMVAMIWQAILNLVIGNLSDKKRYDKNGNFVGKKRPFILRTAIPTGVLFAVMYIAVDFGPKLTVVYYLAIAILYFIAYVSFEVPYYAMAGSLSADGDERTKIRTVATSVEYVGSLIMSIIPPLVLDKYVYGEGGGTKGWLIIGLVFGVFTIVLLLTCAAATKGRELEVGGEEEDKFNLKDSLTLLKIKPYLVIIIAVFIYFFYYTMTSGSYYYFMALSGYSGAKIAIVYVYGSALGIGLVAVAGKLAEKYDKKKLLVGSLFFTGLCDLIYSFVGLNSLGSLFLYGTTDCIQGCFYWTILFLLIYDCADFDELQTGKRREGAMTGLYSFVVAIAAALATQLTGILWDFYGGFDENTWSGGADIVHGMLMCSTRWPGLALILTGVVLCGFSLTKEKTALIAASLEKKKNGEAYSTDGYNDLL